MRIFQATTIPPSALTDLSEIEQNTQYLARDYPFVGGANPQYFEIADETTINVGTPEYDIDVAMIPAGKIGYNISAYVSIRNTGDYVSAVTFDLNVGFRHDSQNFPGQRKNTFLSYQFEDGIGVNIGAAPPETSLFGHVRGALTGSDDAIAAYIAFGYLIDQP